MKLTQDVINKIYEQYEARMKDEDEDPDKVDEEYRLEIKDMNGEFYGCDWKEFGSGDSFSTTLLKLLEKKTGCTVLDDPAWEGSDYVGIIIFWK